MRGLVSIFVALVLLPNVPTAQEGLQQFARLVNAFWKTGR